MTHAHACPHPSVRAFGSSVKVGIANRSRGVLESSKLKSSGAMADSKHDKGILIEAMAMRVKYRKTNSDDAPLMLYIPVTDLGVHKKNRGGVYPAGVRCKSLCEEVVVAGFMQEEKTTTPHSHT